MKKVLIFGVGGFVGGYLSKEFLENGYMVYGSDKVKNITLPEAVVFRSVDLLNNINVEELVGNISPDIIVNLAAISSVGASWRKPQATVSVNVVGALNIMEAARKIKNKVKILFIGSSEEYVVSECPISEDRPLNASNPYGISKVTQEQFVKLYREQFDMQIHYVRPFNHIGVGQGDEFVLANWCKQVAEIEKSGRSGVIKVGNLGVKRDFSHVKDIVKAYRMIIESDNCEVIYNVGSGKAYCLEEILQYIISLSNQDIAVKIDPARIRPIDHPVICCDNRLITLNLGWTPQYTVFDALKEMFESNLH